MTFSGLVGDTTPLGAITINSANNVTANGVRAASFTQTTGQGTTTLNGGTFTDTTVEALKTTSSTGVSVTAKAITLNDKLTTSGTGAVVLSATANSGGVLTIAAAGDIVANNDVDLTGTGGISTAGDVTTNAASAPVNYHSATTLTGAVAIDTTNAGGVTGSLVRFFSTLDGNQTLGVTAGTTGM